LDENMSIKTHVKEAGEIKPIATGYGACFATSEIAEKGRKVGYFYREKPDSYADSGWRFLSGYESAEFMANPNNIGLYDINIIANCDPDIIAYLHKPIGSVFIRDPKTGAFLDMNR
jgi:hypothetical protein